MALSSKTPTFAVDRKAAFDARQVIEDDYAEVFDAAVLLFLTQVADDAKAALQAPVLLAGGRIADPFAFTNVLERWYATVRELAASRGDVVSDEVLKSLMETDLPAVVHTDVVGLLNHSVEGGWTEYKTKRELSKMLIPKQGSMERSLYRDKIRGLARSSATRKMSILSLQVLVEQGFVEKEWASIHDSRVRRTHSVTDGQVRPIDQAFLVGSSAMMAPGDPSGPPKETYSCRCVVIGAGEPVTPEDATIPEPRGPGSVTASGEDGTLFTTTEDTMTTKIPQSASNDRFLWRAGDVTMYAQLAAADSSLSLLAAAIASQDLSEYPKWSGIIGMEKTMTGDGRLIEDGALDWAGLLPFPLRYVEQDTGGHDNAVAVGLALTAERLPSGAIFATGIFDLTADAEKAMAKVANQVQNGVSMDLDAVDFEIRIAGDVWKAMNQELDDEGMAEFDVPDPDEAGRITVFKMGADDEVMVTTHARTRGVTLVSIPAFAEAKISLDDGIPEPDLAVEKPAESVLEALVAAAAPMRPPKEWLADPVFSEVTPLTVTAEGRVYGHMAQWGTCHIGIQDRCEQPPESPSDYAYFHTGALLCADGSEVAVGRLTMGTGHADGNASPLAAMAHYDNTGSVAADVRAGQDSFGIWFAGAVRPNLTEGQIREFRAAPLSGDWRRINGALELVASLSVNTAGFMIPRTRGFVASGAQQSLTAAGMVAPSVIPERAVEGFSVEDIRLLKRLAAKASSEAATKRGAVLRQRVLNLAQSTEKLRSN